MQIRHSLLCLATTFFSTCLYAQTTHFPLWAKENAMLERMEIKQQRSNSLNLSAARPFLRSIYVQVADSLLRMPAGASGLTPVDRYNLQRMLVNNPEYSGVSLADYLQANPALSRKKFIQSGNLAEINQKGFYLSLNPAVTLQQGMASDLDDPVFYRAGGAVARGMIADKLAFNLMVTAHQEAGPSHFNRFIDQTTAVPGALNHTRNSDGSVRYTDIRGSVNWQVTNYIQMQVGRDQQFIGNGYRSLMLSGFSGPHNYFRINTRIWKLQYTNLFMQLSPTADADLNDGRKKKYAAMHHLGVNLTKWLTVGAFESIIFGRDKRYDFSYLVPVIFYRSIEFQNGSPDNANIGFDVKANLMKRLQVYGQLMVDELVVEEAIGAKRNWWGNKQAFQAGARYVDAFGIKNLDLQVEMNQIRPFMYQFRDTAGAYAHGLQPLAHPLGANLREFTGLLRYQPLNRLYIHGRVNVWKQGLDSAGFNFGSNPNDNYNKVGNGGMRPRDDRFPLFAGKPATGFNAALTVSYELAENLFAEGNGMLRRFEETGKAATSATMFSFGIRWNMGRRDYDY